MEIENGDDHDDDLGGNINKRCRFDFKKKKKILQ